MGDDQRAVRIWLWGVAALVALTLVVGGATRLTGSGLSIIEWRPVTGVVPPLSEAEWLSEFEKYRAIPQFRAVNPDMTLAGFKFIYWWEWSHRMLGRLIGVAFVGPFLWFVWRGRIGGTLAWKLGGLFTLGALQGAIGWWMVSSGLAERTDVSQYRLAVHMTLACLIFAALVALAMGLREQRIEPAPRRAGVMAAALVGLIFVQIFSGALVAKTGAGLTFNTWPLIDGRFIPPLDALFAMRPAWINVFENVITVQFSHRMLAYLLFLLAAVHAFDLQRSGAPGMRLRAAILFALVTGQAMLGVMTLLHGAPLPLALAHQAGAVLVLLAATVHLTEIGLRRDRRYAASP